MQNSYNTEFHEELHKVSQRENSSLLFHALTQKEACESENFPIFEQAINHCFTKTSGEKSYCVI
jgi:hypothetical protein